MNRKTYLEALKREISTLPINEQTEVLEDYEEHFEMAGESGRSDEDIIRGLGSPRKIAKELLAQTEIAKAAENPSLSSVTKAVFASVGLGLFNLIFVLAPFLVMIIIPIALIIIAAVFLSSPIILLIQEGFTTSFLTNIFLIMGFIGIGLLFIIFAIKVFKLFYKVILSYLNFNLSIVRRNHS
ncbi:HAAS signaling domain-containing protein [Bacillus sp. NEB1478]|uniref:HAAS signaling domain-containing protein n=1 Tax=Bacillus sp. NEB1478 TaxID=3073816 RepID=UPI0028736D56|nr:DUF1700 domain-containing protein [Bacillus sp. NEB1478]WNB90793.1 DUF1700 domain-containing protein [Bacillus sp. NEB1478]